MEESNRKKLNFKDCMGICIGCIIGSGIMVYTGISVGMTGYGTPYAFILAAVVVILMAIPTVILSGTIPANGGGYYWVKTLIGEKVGFFFLAMFFLMNITICSYALGFASYLCSLFPGVNEKVAAICILIVAVVLNIVGLKTAAIVQNIMVVLLLITLGLFIAFGLPRVDWSGFVPTMENIMPNGAGSFLLAVAILNFATGGAKSIAELGDEIENPKKNIPRAIILSTVIVSVFYALIGIIASGVLPLEDVAYENLTLVANSIFPTWLYYVFIIFGALFALATSLNGTLSWVTRALQVAAKDDWLPAVMGKENKAGAPVPLLILFFLLGAVPILLDIDLTTISTMGIGVTMVCLILENLACFLLPKKYPEEYAQANNPSRSVLNVFIIICFALNIATFMISFSDLTPKIWLAVGIYVVVVLVYIAFRNKYLVNKRLAAESK